MDRALRASLVGGAVSGLVGLAGFFAWHWWWIAPALAVLWEGIVLAPLAGAAVGWAYHATGASSRFGPGGAGGALFGFLFWLALLPFVAWAAVVGPAPDVRSLRDVLPQLPMAALGFPAGAAVGYFVGRTRRAAAVAGLVAGLLWFVPGGGIAHSGLVPFAVALWLILLPTTLGAGAVLAVVRNAMLARDA